MSWVRFETSTELFERAKTVHALDRAAIVIDRSSYYTIYKQMKIRTSNVHIFVIDASGEPVADLVLLSSFAFLWNPYSPIDCHEWRMNEERKHNRTEASLLWVFADEERLLSGIMEVTDTRFTLRPFCSPHQAQKHLVRDMCEVFADNWTLLGLLAVR
jgi:hypothetical protein